MKELKFENQLRSIFANINEWLKFAEAKNFGLLTLSVAFIFGLTQIDFSADSKLLMQHIVSLYHLQFSPL